VKVLDLFSGIGGFSLGLERAGMETAAFCEIDPYCREVLKKHWPNIPIHEDIKELDGRQYRGAVDVVCGGFPCQPYSVAGDRRGSEDDRALWPQMLRVISEVRPYFVFGENVTGIIKLELDRVLSDLENLGYSCGAFVLPACALDAPHRRDRTYILAHTHSSLIEGNGGSFGGEQERTHDSEPYRWEAPPRVCRMDDGVPNWSHRVRALGNAVVPQVIEVIGRAIMEEHGKEREREFDRQLAAWQEEDNRKGYS